MLAMKILTLTLLFVISSGASALNEPLNRLKVRIFSTPSWCGSCRNLEKHLQQTGQERYLKINYQGKPTVMLVEIYDPDKLSADKLTSLGHSNDGIPEYVVVKRDGTVIARDSGYVGGSSFSSEILRLLGL